MRFEDSCAAHLAGKCSLPRAGGLVLVLIGSCLAAPLRAEESDWPGFRGRGDSSSQAKLPLTWSDDENIGWTCELKGYGQSSPVVRGDRIFVTSAEGENKETLVVACIAADSGKTLWQKEAPSSLPAKATDYISRGAPTPVVDARGVYAFFESGDLLAFTHAGELLWSRDLAKDYGPIEGNHGLGGSPAQTDETVILLVANSGPSYLAAFDKHTGETVWKQDREARVSWSSPIVSPGPNGLEIFVSSNGLVQSFNAKTGALLWEVRGLEGNTVASPSVTAESVLVGSSQAGNNLLIRRGGEGDVTDTHVAWRVDEVSSSFGSPLVHQGRAYFVNKTGVAFAVDLQQQKLLWKQRLPDSTWASPIASGNRIYFFCKNGEAVVVRAADAFEKLAENSLNIDDRVYGVAVARGGFVIRSGSRLTFIRP